MKKWDYKEINEYLTIEKIKALGKQGWEMTAYYEDGRGNYVYYFKKEITL